MQAYKLPIFITVFDRLEVLKMSIQSYYDNISGPFEIIIHDNGTTYPPTLEFIKNSGFRHYKSDNESNAVSKSIIDWYKTNDSPYYIVTDPDIALDNTNKDILEFFSHILDTHKDLTTIGTSLRTDDIPDCYKLKQRAIDWEKQWWLDSTKGTLSWKGKTYSYNKAWIDTTFSMYRKSFTFKKINIGLRIHPPYSAKHLDWYLDSQNLTEDQKYYIKTANERTHWSSVDKAH